jgi:hypothetical protein
MPNFDGKGPLKRGRVIGRGRGACIQNANRSCPRDPDPETPENEEVKAE